MSLGVVLQWSCIAIQLLLLIVQMYRGLVLEKFEWFDRNAGTINLMFMILGLMLFLVFNGIQL